MAPDYEVRLLAADDLDEVADHMMRQVAQSGRDGLPIFNPFSVGFEWDRSELRRRRADQWKIEVGQVGWGRGFGARHGGEIIGHLDINGAHVESARHRGLLMMGIEREHHRQGLGRRLVDTAIAWCLESTSLEWIDLNVFAHNEPARALYRGAGFAEVATTVDRFRVDGTSIDDIHMVLDLRLRRSETGSV